MFLNTLVKIRKTCHFISNLPNTAHLQSIQECRVLSEQAGDGVPGNTQLAESRVSVGA